MCLYMYTCSVLLCGGMLVESLCACPVQTLEGLSVRMHSILRMRAKPGRFVHLQKLNSNFNSDSFKITPSYNLFLVLTEIMSTQQGITVLFFLS